VSKVEKTANVVRFANTLVASAARSLRDDASQYAGRGVITVPLENWKLLDEALKRLDEAELAHLRACRDARPEPTAQENVIPVFGGDPDEKAIAFAATMMATGRQPSIRCDVKNGKIVAIEVRDGTSAVARFPCHPFAGGVADLYEDTLMQYATRAAKEVR
jgi:hypothetical protein